MYDLYNGSVVCVPFSTPRWQRAVAGVFSPRLTESREAEQRVREDEPIHHSAAARCRADGKRDYDHT